jgi:fucose permease
MSNLYPLTTSLGLQAASDNANAAGSRLSLATGVSMFLSPLVFGILTDLADIRVAFAVEPLFLAAAVCMAWFGAKWMRAPAPVRVIEGYAG